MKKCGKKCVTKFHCVLSGIPSWDKILIKWLHVSWIMRSEHHCTRCCCLPAAIAYITQLITLLLKLETTVHPKVRNHGEGPY